jgi:hypothetical protein
MRVASIVLLLVVAGTTAARAQAVPAAAGGRTGSLGQPTTWNSTGHLALGRDDHTHIHAAFGLQRDLINPMLSLVAIHGEVYAAAGDDGMAAGLRGRVLSPFARFAIGADYRPAQGRPDLLLSLFHPLRRGGLFADGSVLRVDYLPGRGHAASAGIEKPLFRGTATGRSRPARTHVRLPGGRIPPPHGGPGAAGSGADAGAAAAFGPQLAAVADAARLIRMTTVPLGPVPGHGGGAAHVRAEVEPVRAALARAATGGALHHGAAAAHGADGGTAIEAVRRYHHALALAFSVAAADTAGTTVVTPHGAAAADAAREILLEHVLLPYNRLLGQTKRPDRLDGLAARAYGAFERWLHLESGSAAGQRAAALVVFSTLLDIVEENRAALSAQWRDSRFVWLPLQYALLPEQHATQAGLDAIIERAVGVRFSEGNFVSYLVNEQFQYQLSQTIQDARSYHVLWTHDFRGLDAAREPDEMAYRHVLISYLGTMTQRVREYDATGVFPTYMIVLDQWFYEVNRSRLWLSLLEDPLHHRLSLPRQYAAWQDSIAAAQHALREAVAGSPLLQAQARLHGAGWLRDLVKVHVNITNPADPSFWSTGVVRPLPLPDNMMRDHRKIVFYDVTEENPYSGAAIFTGAGIGEHYANLSWEDRSMLVRGPALLPLKAALRELLINQGLRPARMPHPLLPRPLPADYDEQVRDAARRNQQPLRALQVHNGAGFADKDVNVAKAVLYTLMPPGSVLKIPDSLWNSDFWGSLLLGCALRGGRVLIIAPARGNAPVDAFGTLGRSREMLGRVLLAQQALTSEIEQAGGLLRIGLYHTDLEVTDIPAKIILVAQAFTAQPWLGSLFGFPDSVLEELPAIAGSISDLSMAPHGLFEFEHDPRPKLHFKSNYFASREAWTMMQRPEWAHTAWQYMQQRVSQVQTRAAAVHTFTDGAEPFADAGGGMVLSWYETLDAPTRERVIFYTLMGSHNQNSRSMVIDAEVGFLIAQWPAIIPYIDLVVLVGQTRWMEQAADLAALLPEDTGWRRRMAQWLRLAM